ncbi:hypothetical protein NPX13_g8336 [Xylaria arbuscula]|uniref:Uncharacterized protein n=1 Tax=Xylaria arbuscula TaxID=114810 RepID=A0A9W8N8D0_9PEZI|nr:hypothetical protein NPX13_g8336 [Xylaria arbuscula]
MAIFVDLDEEAEPPQTQAVAGGGYGDWNNERTKLQLQQELLAAVNTPNAQAQDSSVVVDDDNLDPAADKGTSEIPNRTRMTDALACYPDSIVARPKLARQSVENMSPDPLQPTPIPRAPGHAHDALLQRAAAARAR